MKVKLLVPRATNNGAENIGDIVDVTSEEAEAMSAAGQCEIVRRAKPERAEGPATPPEQA